MNSCMKLKQMNISNSYKNNTLYLGVYEQLLKNKNITNIIQIGYNDELVKLFNNCIPTATIYNCIPNKLNSTIDQYNIKCFDTTPYDATFINQIKEVSFDLLIYNDTNGFDSETNNFHNMSLFLELYLPLIKENGILIIEDIKDIQFLDKLVSIVPDKYKKYIKTYDLREINNRSHDVLFIIDTKNLNNIPEIVISNKNNEIELNENQNIDPLDICLVINTCKQNSSNINELLKQIELYNNIFPRENILIVSGQEDMNSISILDGIKYVKVTYSSIHLTSSIYINENIQDFNGINYWVLLPDTIKFGKNFFTNIFKYYKMMKNNSAYSLPFINPILRPTMDIGIIHTKHLMNMTNYLKKVKVHYIDKHSLLSIKKQLIYDENTILGLRAVCFEVSTKFEYLFTNNPPSTFITNSNLDIEISRSNNVQCVYLKILDLYKYQKNFDGPYSELFIAF